MPGATEDLVDQRLVEWWQARSEDLSPRLDLPRGTSTNAPHGLVPALPGQLVLTLPGELLESEDADDRLGCVLAGLLGRYTFDRQVCLVVGRSGQWTPMRLDLASDPTFGQALSQWRGFRDEAAAVSVPLSQLVSAVPDAAALTQVALQLDDTRWPLDTAPVIHARVIGEALRFDWDDTVAAATSTAVVSHFAALLDGWRRDVALSAAPMLSEAERASLLSSAAGTRIELESGTVWDRIRDTALASPEAPAVTSEGESLNYRELLVRVEALARELGRRDIGPGDLVGLCIDRSVDMVVGLLAIMRSGAAYVPIDPTYPRARIAMMVEDAAMRAVVTERAFADVVPGDALLRVLVEDVREPVALGLGSGDGRPSVADLAYVIFTSGSTGRPKGVMIGHRALTNFVTAMSLEPGIAPTDRLLAVTTLSFDIAGLELLVPLTVGGSVVVATRQTLVDPVALAAQISDEDITVMQATPATWRMLVDSGWQGQPGLRVLCGGEALPTGLARELSGRCAEVWNLYGPTETTIWSLATRLDDSGPVTIGTPIANTTVYIVGPTGELVPDAVLGELWIGGAGLAEGYLGKPELTAKQFVPDNLGREPGGRLYRTGDLVRRCADGLLEYIGRLDGQVKVRGFRIELGEVETALDTHPDVARSVAVVRRDERSGANQLVAYTVLNWSATAEGRDLRLHVTELLPAYMVPSLVVVVDSFPMTLNGKVDRRALVESSASPVGGLGPGPRTLLEAQLGGIWERVLKITPIAMTDDVFDLGSDSLTTARLFAEVARELDVVLPIAAAFQARTIESLATLIEGLRASRLSPGDYDALVPIRRTGTRRPLFLVHGGAGTVLLFEPLTRRLGADQPVYAFQAVGLYGVRAPQASVTAMAKRYIQEMRSVQPEGPYLLGGYCFGALVAFEMACQLENEGQHTELLVTFNGPSPSYLERFRPMFDAQGSRTDQSGAMVRGRRRSVRAAVGDNWRDRSSLPAFLEQVSTDAAKKVRMRVRVEWRRQFERACVRLGRPLPERLRETGAFQRLAAYAQDRYRPGRFRGDMTVICGDGLYHRDDLGWIDHVAGKVTILRVPGDQLTPRDSMRDGFVQPIAEGVARLLTERDGSSLDDPDPGLPHLADKRHPSGLEAV